MPVLHKLVLGGEHLLGVARSRYDALVAAFGPDAYTSQKWVVDGCRVEVELRGEFHYIRIFGADSMYFEFATSGYPVVHQNVTQESQTFDTYKGCIVGVKVTTLGDAGISVSPKINGQKRTISGADVSLIGRAYQQALINEPVGYPRKVTAKNVDRYPTALYESWAPGSPNSGVPIRNTELVIGSDQFFTGPTETYTIRDRFFDVPFQYGIGRSKVKTAYLRGSRDWPRASGLQTVTDTNYGTREFAIYVDSFNQFSAFPLDAIDTPDGITQNVDDTYVRTVAPALPDWVYKPATKLKDYAGTPQHGLLDFPELDWKLNHLGTKATAIAYERLPYENDADYWAIDASAYPWTQGYFDQMAGKMGVLGRDTQYDVMADYNNDRHFIAPGVLEAKIKITLTGENRSDFTLAVTIHEVRKPSTMSRWALLAGYVWHDIEKEPKTVPPMYLAKAGDLVSIDHELWRKKFGTLNDWVHAVVTDTVNPYLGVLSWRKLNSGPETYATEPTEVQCRAENPILAIDLTTLSCVMQTASTVGLDQVSDLYGAGSDDALFGAAVIVKGKLRELLLPKTAATAPGQSLAAHKANMEASINDDARQRINGLVEADARWQRILPTPDGGDGWANTAFNTVRESWARGDNEFHFTPTGDNGGDFPYGGSASPWDIYKTGSAPSLAAPEVKSAIEDLYGRWLTPRFSNLGALFVCREPKWGWHLYAACIGDIVWLSPEVTFFTHPNGTWCYWDNTSVYVPHPYTPFVLGVSDRGFTNFDAAKVEHVVFDRVHFERKRKSGAAVAKDTTFFALYNKAVQKGRDADSLELGIDAMTDANIRATLTKFPQLEVTIISSVPYISPYLALVADWNGGTWYKPDSLYVDDNTPFSGTLRLPPGGQMTGLRFDQGWYTLPYYDGDREYPSRVKPHVRIANPVLIE